MKKPFVTQSERDLIRLGTLSGSIIMINFRLEQLKRAIREVNIGRLVGKLLHRYYYENNRSKR